MWEVTEFELQNVLSHNWGTSNIACWSYVRKIGEQHGHLDQTAKHYGLMLDLYYWKWLTTYDQIRNKPRWHVKDIFNVTTYKQFASPLFCPVPIRLLLDAPNFHLSQKRLMRHLLENYREYLQTTKASPSIGLNLKLAHSFKQFSLSQKILQFHWSTFISIQLLIWDLLLAKLATKHNLRTAPYDNYGH